MVIFIVYNVFILLDLKKNLKSRYKKESKNKDFFGSAMPSEKDHILELNQYLKSEKMPYIIYADIKSLITYKHK